MMCADWSPDPNCPDLVAVGLTTGRTLLVRMQEHALTEYPSSESVINQRMLPSKYPSLGVKMSRTSNVVSFSKTHPHLLAVGLDKVRNEPCLFVWDISRSMESYTPTGSQTPIITTFRDAPRSTRSVDIHEDRSRYNDLSISAPTSREAGPIRQYGSSEVISSCAWSEHASAPILIAGMANKYLRVYDIRSDTNSLQFSTKAVYGTTIDPFNPYRIASYTEEGVIKIWDTRKHTDAVLTLNPETKNNISKIVFSPAQRGLLASLSKDAQQMHLWDIQETCSLQSAVNNTSVKQKQSDEDLGIPVLWKSRKTRSSTRPFASFTFIPKMGKGTPPQLLGVHTDGSFEAVKVEETSQMAWQPTGGVIMAGRKGLLACQPTSILDEKMAQLNLDKENRTHQPIDMSQSIQQSADYLLAEELERDISVVMRKRLLEGYSMDCEKNLKIIKHDRSLRELWTWMKIADQIAPKLSKVGNIDYSFHGVYGIWMGSHSRQKSSSPAATPRLSSPRLSREPSTQSVKDLFGGGDMPMVETARVLQRNIALIACGLALNNDEFEVELRSLELKGEYDKAAALALFHGKLDRAIEALNSSRGKDDQQQKLMSAILASYQSGTTTDTWKSICESLCADMVDRPYLKAIFAYIASDDWFRVLDEPGLPLRERMAIALRILDDDQMTDYLNRTVDKAIENGDVEGIVVTGLTLKGIDILEKALDKYGDVQTASLVMSFIVPKRFKDHRVEDWVEK
ncbi:unnamed protein product [Rhizopus microsporus]